MVELPCPAGADRAAPELSIVIVTYNNELDVSRCLAAIPSAVGDHLSWEVLVVDNGSNDATVERVRAALPKANLVEFAENLGFAAAANDAAIRAQGRWLLLLNPDTEPRPGSFAALVARGQCRPRAGLIGGQTTRPDGQIEPSSAWNQPTLWSIACFGFGLTALARSPSLPASWVHRFDPESVDPITSTQNQPVDVVTGCVLLVAAKVWHELGGFDARFVLYGEDLDLGLRARRAGYQPEICGRAEVLHLVGRSSPDAGTRRSLVLAGRMTYLAKHWSPAAATCGRWLTWFGVAWRARLGGPRASGWYDAWVDRSQWRAGYPVSASGSGSARRRSSLASRRKTST